LDVLDEYKQTPRGASINYVDLESGRVVLGFSSGSKVSTGAETSEAGSSPSVDGPASPGASKSTNNRKNSENISPNDNRQKAKGSNTRREEKPANNSPVRLR